MNIQTKGLLESFFGRSTWSKWEGQEDDRFRDFIVGAFKNGDYSISLDEMRSVAEMKEGRVLTDYEEKALTICDSKFKDGISLLRKN